MPDETAIGGPGRDFPATRWTLIVSSKESSEKRRAALEELLAAYWKPLYFYARRKGRSIEAAKDLIQGFFAHLLQNEFLSRLDPGKGRFRGYLRTSLDHFMANLHESQSAQKRGGGAKNVALDFDVAEDAFSASADDPDRAYTREWALGIMERSLAQLRKEFEQGERRGPFDLALKFFQFHSSPPSYEEAARQAGMTMTQFKAFIHRARERFRELVKREVLQTVATERDADEEIADLMKALTS
jgi:RNA polymerase sigma-70 factor (ECF subfamily)